MKARKQSEIPSLDIGQGSHAVSAHFNLPTLDRIYLATMAQEYGTSEADILRKGLSLLRTLGNMGVDSSMAVRASNADRDIEVVIGLDLTRGAFSVEEFQADY